MEQVKLYWGEKAIGEVTLRPEGARTEIRASMEDPGDGLYRAVLIGERGELMLGVLEPVERHLIICRRLYSRDVAGIGTLLRGEARCSFRFSSAASWQETACPAQLFQSRFFQSRLRSCGQAWWRRDRGKLYLALPLEQGKPFPLEAVFCLARVGQVAGRRCAVYVFDQHEDPLLPQGEKLW